MTTVMIVDDHESVRAACSAMLDQAGYRSLEAENGKTAIKLLDTEAIDVVITDIIMPEQEGIETIRLIRKGHPGVKIIAMSGGGRIEPEEYLAVAEKIGAHVTLQKPFKKEQLLRTVCAALEAV